MISLYESLVEIRIVAPAAIARDFVYGLRRSFYQVHRLVHFHLVYIFERRCPKLLFEYADYVVFAVMKFVAYIR